jgi:hypothetical protein
VTTTIVPSLGAGIDFTQGGVGAAPGYAAIDVRRGGAGALLPGPIGSGYGGGAGSGAYAVTQRQAGSNMSVDIAANIGALLVAGTTISFQGNYWVPPHSAVISETISAADATNPRVDQIIVQTFDNAIDSSGLNTSRTTVLTGTPTAGASVGISGNRNGAAALPANSYRLADVVVPAGSTSVTNANIFDRRPKQRGWANIATSEVRTNTAYGLLPTPDQVTELVLPANGLIAVWYQATWQQSGVGTAQAAIFLGTNQLKVWVGTGGTVPTVQNAGGSASSNINTPLFTYAGGLTAGGNSSNYTGDVTTGQIVGSNTNGGPCYIFAAAGTYHVSVQFAATSGSVTASNRKLWVWTMAPDQAVLA